MNANFVVVELDVVANAATKSTCGVINYLEFHGTCLEQQAAGRDSQWATRGCRQLARNRGGTPFHHPSSFLLALAGLFVRTGRGDGKHSAKSATLVTAADPPGHVPARIDLRPSRDINQTFLKGKLGNIGVNLLGGRWLRHSRIPKA